MSQQHLSILAGVLAAIGFMPYIWAMFRDRKLPPGTKNKVEPVRGTWFVWAVTETIMMYGMISKGSLNFQIVAAVTFTWAIFVMAAFDGVLGNIMDGKPAWEKVDTYCLGGAIASILVWKFFDEPNFGIIATNIVVFLGSYPTWESAWKNPGRESKWAWIIWWVSSACAVIAIPQLTIGDALQPWTFITVQSIMLLIIFIRPWFLRLKRA